MEIAYDVYFQDTCDLPGLEGLASDDKQAQANAGAGKFSRHKHEDKQSDGRSARSWWRDSAKLTRWTALPMTVSCDAAIC